MIIPHIRLRKFGALLLFFISATLALAQPAWKNQTILVTWQDNSPNETGFSIERSTDGVTFRPLAVVAANATSFRDTGRSPGIYYYRVIALFGSDRSGPSNVARVVVTKF